MYILVVHEPDLLDIAAYPCYNRADIGVDLGVIGRLVRAVKDILFYPKDRCSDEHKTKDDGKYDFSTRLFLSGILFHNIIRFV